MAYDGQIDESLRHAAILLRDHADDPDVLLSVGHIFHVTGDNQRAVDYANLSLAQRPGWKDAIRASETWRRIVDRTS